MENLDRIASTEWDVVIIGAGMGGSVLGYELARAGKKVLFCEKGKSTLNGNTLRGAHAELVYERNPSLASSLNDALLKGGRWNEEIEDRTNGKSLSYIPFAGSGTGGSTNLFGTVMQRFAPEDFTPRSNFPDLVGSNLPEAWPITYDELRPYYREAEVMFGVKGDIDPFRNGALDPLPPREPIPSGEVSEELLLFLRQKGLNPYRPPLACDFLKDCTGCQGYLCDRGCKNDSAKICMAPALNEHGAVLLEQCRGHEVVHDGKTATGIICEVNGRPVVLKGKRFVLAAGGLETPAMLFRSGLGARSGMLGKNLMRNFYDLYFIFPKNQKGIERGIKEIYVNDFYTKEAGKLGIIQSFGPVPPIPLIVKDLESDLKDSKMAFLAPIFSFLSPVIRRALASKFSKAYILVTTMEDMPYSDNEVMFADSGKRKLAIKYSVRAWDKKRINLLREKMRSVLKPYDFILSGQAEQNKRFISLACGTARFGSHPDSSVLDKNNRVHDLNNLYVVDASFFPSNPGLNSGLTVAANSLRVARTML